jgi:hypothetical protein
MKLKADLVLLVGVLVLTVGMALVAFGVVVSALFFPGVYLLAFGMFVTGAGALLRVIGAPTP